jgi:hypothetical protein
MERKVQTGASFRLVMAEFTPDRSGASMSRDQAASTGRGHSLPSHRRPHLRQRNKSMSTPLCRSMPVSGLRMPLHIQHRVLLPSTSATRLFWFGIVVLLGQAFELLIQEDEGMSSQRFA